MNAEDIAASIGTSLSAIGATISAWYSNAIVSSLFTFLVGAFVTFAVQSKLQDRSEKRKQKVQAIKKVHIPLFLRIEDIKETFLLKLEDVNVGTWNPIFDKPEMFTLKLEFKNQIIDLFEKTNKLEEDFQGLKGTIVDIIFKNTKNKLVPMLKEKGLVKPDDNSMGVTIEKGADKAFSVHIDRGESWGATAPSLLCAVLNENPVSYIEKRYKAFETDKISLCLTIQQLLPNQSKPQHIKVDLAENMELFNTYWEQLIADINNNQDIAKFNQRRKDIIPCCDELLSKLKKHIEKYVEIQEI